MGGWFNLASPLDMRGKRFDGAGGNGGQRWCPILLRLFFPFFVYIFRAIRLQPARSEMYHDGICFCKRAGLGGGGDLSATDEGLWGNNSCMRSCFPSLNGVSMSLGPCVACRLSEVVDLAWPSCIISLLKHVVCVSPLLTSITLSHLFLSQFLLSSPARSSSHLGNVQNQNCPSSRVSVLLIKLPHSCLHDKL